MKKISKNISYKEATYSNYAKKYKIANKPDDEQIENMKLVAEEVFQPLREWANHPIKVNSFFRSKKLNSGIGGSSVSSHLTGNAIDITTLGEKTNLELFNYIKDNLEFDQLIWEFGTNSRPDWVHVSYKKGGPQRGQILTAKRNSSGKTYYEPWKA